jgi:orotate phosphoribosyltransferase
VTAEALRELLERRGAMLTGHFLLSSGLHSGHFIQKFRIFEDPATADEVGAALADLLRPAKPQVVVSAAVGGIILGFVVARALGVRNIFVEKEGGQPVLRRGFRLEPGERAAVVEDVMTTGKSVAEVIDVVRGMGAECVAIGAVVKRGRVELPLPVSALLDLPLEDFDPAKCPLCREGAALSDPGTRRA